MAGWLMRRSPPLSRISRGWVDVGQLWDKNQPGDRDQKDQRKGPGGLDRLKSR
jgi:hypothetical protein